MFAVMFGFVGPTAALASPTTSVDSSDSPSPTPTPSPTSAAPGCGSGLTTPGRNWGAGANAPNQGTTNGTSFTNPTTVTFTDTVFEVQLYEITPSRDTVAAHFPTFDFSWDEGPWRPVGPWSQNTASGLPYLPNTSMPGLLSARMPGTAFLPGTTHTLQFWASFAPGTPDVNFAFIVYIEQPGCPSGALSTSAPMSFGLGQASHAPVPAGRVAAPVSSVPNPTTPPATVDPTMTSSIAPTLMAQPGRSDPLPGGMPWTSVGLGATAAVFAAFAARMVVGWWSAGRRLP